MSDSEDVTVFAQIAEYCSATNISRVELYLIGNTFYPFHTFLHPSPLVVHAAQLRI
jgi:hypothetical protein